MPYIADEVKENRLSALAQLCELLIADGLTTTPELCKRTGYGERAIRKARAELECRNSSAGTLVPSGTLVRNSSSPDKKERSPTPPKEKTTPITSVEPSSTVAAGSALPDAKELFDMLMEAAKGMVRQDAADLQIISVPLGWLQAGASLELDVLPLLRAKAAKAKAPYVKSWNYYTQMVADAVAARKSPLPAGNVLPLRPTATAQRPIYQVPTRPVYNHRDEGISIEDALARKLITEEQAAEYRSQMVKA